MTVAQKLYEQGHITYMRTDSLNLSPKFLSEAREWLRDNLGAEYALENNRFFKIKARTRKKRMKLSARPKSMVTPEIVNREIR